VGADFCCPEAQFCPGGTESPDLCCTGTTTCCSGGTNSNACIDLTVENACCIEADCGDPCQVCNRAIHQCVERCPGADDVCCTEQAGPGVCVRGNCCPGAPCGDGGECCPGATAEDPSICIDPATQCCVNTDCAPAFPPACEVRCNPENHFCVPLICLEGEICCRDAEGFGTCVDSDLCPCVDDTDCPTCQACRQGVCQPANEGQACVGTADDDEDTGICCDGVCLDVEICPGLCDTIDDCDDCQVCQMGICQPCEAVGNICCGGTCVAEENSFSCGDGCCPIEDTCCEGFCCTGECLRYREAPDVCCTTLACDVSATESRECCPNVEDYKCCGTVGCCTSSACNEEANVCCDEGFACGATEGNVCCDTETEKCCEGVCIPASECCPAIDPDCPVGCEPNCDCSDPANDGLDCNGGIAAGGGVCACGFCVVPLDGCPCGCAGDTECVACDGNGGCVPINQGEPCNGGAGICDDVWCVDAPPCADTGAACEFNTDCCEGVCFNGTCVTEVPLCAPLGQSCETLDCCDPLECCRLLDEQVDTCHTALECIP
jgi:hypothetical protein